MGLFAAAASELRSYRLSTFSPQSTAYWVAKLFGGGFSSASGISVTPDTAITIAAVYAAIRNVSEDLAALPLPVYRELGSGQRERDRTDPAWRLLNVAANPEMSAMAAREAIIGHALLTGDGYWEIERNDAQKPVALWPLNPRRMRLARNGKSVRVVGAGDGQLIYVYDLPNGGQKLFTPDLIFHLHGFGPDGLRGYSVVGLARETMGLALGAEAFGARLFANNATPDAVLTHPKTLSDKARENLRLSWDDAHKGLENAHRMAILEEGLDIKAIGINPEDAQFLETRKFSVAEVSRWFRVPPDKLSDLDRATFSNIEQSDINYVKYTILPWAIRADQQITRRLLDAQHTAEHVVDGLLRGDVAARASFYHSLRQDGALTGNDIRAKENLAPVADAAADQLLIPLNMVPASAIRPDGLTLKDRYTIAFDLVRDGFVPAEVLAALDLPAMGHTGYFPISFRLPDQVPADPDATRTNGHTPDADAALFARLTP